MGFGGFALLGKEEPIYISDWRTSQLLSRDVTLHCNYMGCFVRRCTVVTLTLFFTSKGSPALDAGMLHVKTHLDDVINGNNSHPSAEQHWQGRVPWLQVWVAEVTAPPGLVTLCLDLILSRKQAIKPGANLVSDWLRRLNTPTLNREGGQNHYRGEKNRQIWWRAETVLASQRTRTTIWYMETFMWLRFDLQGCWVFTALHTLTGHMTLSSDVSVCLLSISVSQEQMWGGQTAVKRKQTEMKSVSRKDIFKRIADSRGWEGTGKAPQEDINKYTLINQ